MSRLVDVGDAGAKYAAAKSAYEAADDARHVAYRAYGGACVTTEAAYADYIAAINALAAAEVQP